MAAKCELTEPHKGDKRYDQGNSKGHFKESDDVGRSLAADRRRKEKKVVNPVKATRTIAGSLRYSSGLSKAAPFSSVTYRRLSNGVTLACGIRTDASSRGFASVRP